LLDTVSLQAEACRVYHGKQMQMIIRDTPGSGYDIGTRLLARHFGRHIPGNPTMICVNMAGGGGLVAANYIANVAPKGRDHPRHLLMRVSTVADARRCSPIHPLVGARAR